MVNYLLVFCAILFSVFAICFAALAYRYYDLLKQRHGLLQYLKSLSNAIASARWGNFQLKIEDGPTKLTTEISKNLNSLFESVLDRDVMIKEYVEKEKENNSLKEDFIAMLTHDLKVPIIAQDNTFDLFLEGKFGSLSDIQKDAIRNIKVSNLDLKHLVESLLDSHKYEKKGFVVNSKKVVLAALLSDIVQKAGSIALLHNINLNFYNNAPEGFSVETDDILLARVINNLILNAINYSLNSKNIDIALNLTDDGGAEISVKDYGTGISKEKIEKIFNKYYSAAETYSKVSTGLGLYLSNKIVKSLGGKIEVISEEDKGAKFIIILQKQ